MSIADVNADLEFSRLMQTEWRPKIERLMLDADSSCELGPCPETLEPILREAYEAGMKIAPTPQMQAEPGQDAKALGDGELLPYPFCGGKAERVNIEDEADPNYGGSYIACPECLACSKLVFGEKVGLEEAWNRRARPSRPEDAALRELVETLDESLSMLCAICRILNPQHKDCTYCPDTEQERKVLERMRAALASSPREDGKAIDADSDWA